MKLRGRIILLLITVLLLIPFTSVLAETEPNDSLDSPELLTEGSVTGELNTNISDEELWEKDIFRIDMPPNSILFFFLKKTDSNNTMI